MLTTSSFEKIIYNTRTKSIKAEMDIIKGEEAKIYAEFRYLQGLIKKRSKSKKKL